MHSTQVQSPQISNPHHNLYGVATSTTIHSSQSPQSQSIRPILHYTGGNVLTSTTSGSNQSPMIEKRNDVNSHQKLQRQLSLNPNAYDPRLLRMHNANSLQPKHSHPEQMQQEASQAMQHTGHRQLAPSSSGPRSHLTNHWDLHQVRRSPEYFAFNSN